MDETWETILSKDIDVSSTLKENCTSIEDVKGLLKVAQGWISAGIHDIEEEKRCWMCISTILGSVNVKDWSALEFVCRGILLRSKEKELRPTLQMTANALMCSYPEKMEQKCGNILQELLIEAEEDSGTDSVLLLVQAMSLLFPICLSMCKDMLVSTDFQDVLIGKLKLNETVNSELVLASLNLLSVACIDDSMRTFICEHYLKLLEQTFTVAKYKIATALVLIKIWNFTKLQKQTLDECISIFIESFAKGEHVEESTESLAYLTLKPSVRVLLRNNGDVSLKLIEMIKSEETAPSEAYAILCIIANLSSLPTDSGEEDTINKLKQSLKSKQEREQEAATVENLQEIQEFNRDYIIDLDLIGRLKSMKLSTSSFNQAIKIVYNVTRDKKLIADSVKQGAGVMLLVFLAQKREVAKDEYYFLAIRALSKILIHVNPQTAFNKFSPLNTVPFLFEMLPSGEEDAADESTTNALLSQPQFTPLDTYESLLALTNLATINQGSDLGKIIAGNPKYWSTIENLLLDSRVQIQRSTLELISNLMAYPMNLAAKFFNFENPKSSQNFNTLVKLLELQDLQSQRAVAAIFANIVTTVPFICEELSHKENLSQTLIRVFKAQHNDTDLRQRLLVLLLSIMGANPDVVTSVKNDATLLTTIKQYKQSPDPLTSEITTDILKLVS